jgi:hypothetical protein
MTDFESLYELINRFEKKKRTLKNTKEELFAMSLPYFGISLKRKKIHFRVSKNQNKKLKILIDLYSKNNFLENLHSIYVSHCAGSSVNYLPMSVEPFLKEWAYQHLFEVYDKELREFKGHFKLKELQLAQSDQSMFLQNAFFDLIDHDDMLNSLNTSHP